MDEFSGDQWYYDKDTNMIWATHNSSGIGDVNIATLTDINFDANNGRLIAAAPEMYEAITECADTLEAIKNSDECKETADLYQLEELIHALWELLARIDGDSQED